MSVCVVEDGDHGLLPQHSRSAHRLQNRPAHRCVYTNGTLQSETNTHYSRAGVIFIKIFDLFLLLEYSGVLYTL